MGKVGQPLRTYQCALLVVTNKVTPRVSWWVTDGEVDLRLRRLFPFTPMVNAMYVYFFKNIMKLTLL